MTVSRPFVILLLRNFSWVIVVRVLTYILFYMLGPAIFFISDLRKYCKITQIQNGN